MTLGTLIAFVFTLWLVYHFMTSIRTTDVHRQMLYESVYDARLQRLREQAGLDTLSGTGSGEEDSRTLEKERQEKLGRLKRFEELKMSEGRSNAEEVELKNLEVDIPDINAALTGRLSEENIKQRREEEQGREQERQKKVNEMRQTAAHEAEFLVPRSLTVAGMGITGSFFIELTAILTIIFGIIILGLVGVLGTTEIAPILAAIAGYVLGKTTSGWAPYGGAAWLQQPFTPQGSISLPPSPGAGGEVKVAQRAGTR
jgi:hypothetical protein